MGRIFYSCQECNTIVVKTADGGYRKLKACPICNEEKMRKQN